MDFYMVVQIDDDGVFLDEPEYFDTRLEAKEQYKRLAEQHPDLTFAAFSCTEIDL